MTSAETSRRFDGARVRTSVMTTRRREHDDGQREHEEEAPREFIAPAERVRTPNVDSPAAGLCAIHPSSRRANERRERSGHPQRRAAGHERPRFHFERRFRAPANSGRCDEMASPDRRTQFSVGARTIPSTHPSGKTDA